MDRLVIWETWLEWNRRIFHNSEFVAELARLAIEEADVERRLMPGLALRGASGAATPGPKPRGRRCALSPVIGLARSARHIIYDGSLA